MDKSERNKLKLQVINYALKHNKAQAARHFKKDYKTVLKWVNKHLEKRQCTPIGEEVKQEILLLKKQDPEITLELIKERINQNVSLSSIHRFINKPDVNDKIILSNFVVAISSIKTCINATSLRLKMLKAVDTNSGIIFLAFYPEKNSQYIGMFFNHYFTTLSQNTIAVNKAKFFAKKNSNIFIHANNQQAEYIVQTYIKKVLNVHHAEINMLPASYKDKFCDKIITNLSDQRYKTESDFLLNGYSEQLKHNISIIDTLKLAKPIKENLFQLICSFQPPYFKKILPIEQVLDLPQNRTGKDTVADNIIEKVIIYQISKGDKLSQQFSNEDSLREYMVVITLLRYVKSDTFSAKYGTIYLKAGLTLLKLCKTKEAMEMYKVAFNISGKVANDELRGTAAYFYAHLLHQKGKVSKSEKLFLLAINIFENMNNKRKLCIVYGLYTDVLLSRKKITTCITFLKKMKQNALELDDTLELGKVYSKMASVLRIKKFWKLALIFAQKSLEIFEKNNDNFSACLLLGNIGNIYYTMGQYRQAEKYYRKNENLLKTVEDVKLRAKNYASFAHLAFKEEKFAEAINCYQQSLNMLNTIDDKLELCNCFMNIGVCYKKLRNPRIAKKFLLKALKQAQEIKNTSLIVLIKNILSNKN